MEIPVKERFQLTLACRRAESLARNTATLDPSVTFQEYLHGALEKLTSPEILTHPDYPQSMTICQGPLTVGRARTLRTTLWDLHQSLFPPSTNMRLIVGSPRELYKDSAFTYRKRFFRDTETQASWMK